MKQEIGTTGKTGIKYNTETGITYIRKDNLSYMQGQYPTDGATCQLQSSGKIGSPEDQLLAGPVSPGGTICHLKSCGEIGSPEEQLCAGPVYAWWCNLSTPKLWQDWQP